MQQTMLSRNLNAPHKLITDERSGFLSLVPVASEDVAPSELVAMVDVHIDGNLRPQDDQYKYVVTFGAHWLYRIKHGKLPNGKPNHEFNLEELQALDILAKPPKGKTHNTTALGVQCARLYLQTIQELVASNKQTTQRFG